jgi:transcriptional regulator with XRE-family HTH domain
MARKKDNLELKKELGTVVPSCTELRTDELGTRIDAISQQLGTREYAASIAEVSVDQLVAYIKGRNKPAFLPLARLAQSAGVSLDWLATGEGPKYPQARGSPDSIIEEESASYHRFEMRLEWIRKAVKAVQMMGKNAPDEQKAEAVARVYERLVQTDGQADMIEVMQIIQTALDEDTPYI